MKKLKQIIQKYLGIDSMNERIYTLEDFVSENMKGILENDAKISSNQSKIDQLKNKQRKN